MESKDEIKVNTNILIQGRMSGDPELDTRSLYLSHAPRHCYCSCCMMKVIQKSWVIEWRPSIQSRSRTVLAAQVTLYIIYIFKNYSSLFTFPFR